MLHGLDPETYLTDIFRVIPYWPRDRYLELAPKYWRAYVENAASCRGDTSIPNRTARRMEFSYADSGAAGT
jgi:hypothetical protein